MAAVLVLYVSERLICARTIYPALLNCDLWRVDRCSCRNSFRIFISRHHKLSSFTIGTANVIQTVPSLAMLSILMLALGLGMKTVIVTVFLYSLLPIVKNTYTGMISVSKDVIDTAQGMGMTKMQQLFLVELPLAISVIMAGLRNALVVAIGNVAIGAFVGAGGLGDIIIRGTNATDGGAIILAGALPTALMAIIADLALGWVEKKYSRKVQPETAES